MKLGFVWIGKTKDNRWRSLEGDYLARIGQFYLSTSDAIAEQRRSDPRQEASLAEREARLLERKLPSGGHLIALDVRGRQMSSRQLAEYLGSLSERAVKAVTFVSGGFAGVPARLVEKADLALSLGPMTLPHEMARVVLLEQVYRAATILKGTPYHK